MFRILAVCTGNICRSPLAAQLLRARLAQAVPGAEGETIEVSSAGTMALDGSAMEPLAVHEALRLGIHDAAEHRARWLRREQIERADLIIGMAREHRSAVVGSVPRAHRRTFTLVELTRAVEALAAGRAVVHVEPVGDDGAAAFLRGVVEAASVRGLAPMHERFGLDIEDPYGRKPAAYRRSADAVAEHVDRLVVAIGSLATGDRAAVAAQGASSGPA